MKSLKKFFALCLTLALVLSLAACAQKPAETTDPAETPDTPEQEVEAPVTARIAALKGPTAIGACQAHERRALLRERTAL